MELEIAKIRGRKRDWPQHPVGRMVVFLEDPGYEIYRRRSIMFVRL
jgi:hypothetical protein